ncbi:MAG: GTP 3',8-cyclase MoaA [Gammaproteobacteria bacterium]|nr:GTP 3',8-cyclase MoaA [Gammaproteobacteria bacterium]MBU1414840.1 GTP 3',8-cyclase MoaA [Gammaproteobacteria bacterium]
MNTPPTPPAAAPQDRRNRPMRDLRISVTDRCNFRCVYCMPKTVFGRGYPFLPRQEILTYEEIVRLAGLFAAQGIAKVRLTGGEPLLRKDIERLIEQLATIPNLEITLTTNGSLLAARAKGLRTAGLDRITVSLDALDDVVFKRMNDADYPVTSVLSGIDAAAAAGFAPVKINMVVRRGINDQAILPMARHFRGSGHILRFIEYMDAGSTNAWQMSEVVPAAEVVQRINAEFPLETIDPNYQGEVAERWRYRDGSGEIGVIASVTQAFCSECTRIRLSTDGQLYTCLFATSGHDLRKLLRGGANDEEIVAAINRIWQARDDRYSELRRAGIPVTKKIEMSYIGG